MHEVAAHIGDRGVSHSDLGSILRTNVRSAFGGSDGNSRDDLRLAGLRQPRLPTRGDREAGVTLHQRPELCVSFPGLGF